MFSGEVPTGTGVYPDEAQAYFKLPSPTNTASSGQSIICTSWASGSASSSATSASLDSCSYFSPAQSTSPPVADYRILQLSASQARPPHVPHKYVALSTQYVYAGVQRMSMLARISITDYRGNVLYDTFVRPTHQVVDFRPIITGLQPEHLYSSLVPDISVVREQVSAIIRGKVIVGHSLWVDLSLLGLCHPALDTRDVGLFLPFHRTLHCFTTTPLKTLVSHLMRRKIGKTYEHPLEDARAALDLFRSYEDPWEDEIRAGSWPCALPPSAFSRYFS